MKTIMNWTRKFKVIYYMTTMGFLKGYQSISLAQVIIRAKTSDCSDCNSGTKRICKNIKIRPVEKVNIFTVLGIVPESDLSAKKLLEHRFSK